MRFFLYIALASFAINSYAYEFENSTCTAVKEKSKLSPRVVTAIKIDKVENIAMEKAAEFGVWNQKSNSTKFVKVEVHIINGIINKSYYRVINGQLHQSFPSGNGDYSFRRIVPKINSSDGLYEIVNIKGSSFQSSILSNIRCEKNLF